MKKMLIGFLGIVLMCSLALAANGQDAQDTTGSLRDDIAVIQQNASAGERVIASQFQNRISAGEYQVNGNRLMIKETTANKIQLQVRNISVDCDCNLTGEYDPVQNQTNLKMALSNGRNAEVKIMPDVASETALARLRLKVCNESNNCSIELKEVGQDNQTRAAYEVKAEKTFRIFGIFRNRAEVRTQIDAETGEEIEARRPWWTWLASEEDETEELEE